MNIIFIGSIIVVGVLTLGALLAAAFRWFNRAVVGEQNAAEVEMRSYNPGLTYGYKIPVTADVQSQMKAARLEAARQAAALPRGANSGIGKGDQVRTAYQGVETDPISAVKMAAVHSWQGLRQGSAFSPAQTVTHAGAQTAPPTKTADDLVPGVDYEEISITEDMSPAEKRKARIANAKAKSAAVKVLKASTPASASAPAQPQVPATTPVAETGSTPSGVAEPVAGVDYEVIEITDDMNPDEVRKARIANVKAKSAAMKAYKGSAGASAPAPQPAASPVSQVETLPPAIEAEAAPAVPSSVAPPDLIEIVDGMAPDELRKARIHNAKAQAAYKKALKAAGIDPGTV